MKNVVIIAAITSLSSIFSISAQQRPNGGVRGGMIEGGGGPPSPEKILSFLDKNSDNLISRDEAAKARRGRISEMFDTLDKNQDGYISPEELSNRNNQGSKRKKPTPNQIITRMDINKDGVLDKTEVDTKGEKRLQKAFQRIDRNNNGILTKEELELFFKKKKKRNTKS